MDTDAQRLRLIIRAEGLTQAQFAEALGVTPQAVNNVLHGRAALSRELASRIRLEYGYLMDWLLEGQGEPRSVDDTSTTTEAPRPSAKVRRFPPRCDDCGHALEEGDDFCPGCRANLEWPVDEAPSA